MNVRLLTAWGYSDPWAEITKNRLLPNGTKEEILNVPAQRPNTITQIAETLGLSAPSIHTDVRNRLRSELLREAVEWEKTHPAERSYEPNFPVFKAKECAEFRSLCEEMSKELVTLFEKETKENRTCLSQNCSLPKKAGETSDITQCLFANVYRGARTLAGAKRIVIRSRETCKWRGGGSNEWAQEVVRQVRAYI